MCLNKYSNNNRVTILNIVLFYLLYSGVVGPELASNNVSIFITSDAGNSWREVQLSSPILFGYIYFLNCLK